MYGTRLLLQILLLAAFLHFFGLPAVEKYDRKEVMVVETTKDTAITLLFANNSPEKKNV